MPKYIEKWTKITLLNVFFVFCLKVLNVIPDKLDHFYQLELSTCHSDCRKRIMIPILKLLINHFNSIVFGRMSNWSDCKKRRHFLRTLIIFADFKLNKQRCEWSAHKINLLLQSISRQKISKKTNLKN